MSRRTGLGVLLSAAGALWLAGVLSLVPTEAAGQPPVGAAIQAHLAAGEFAPALALARQAPAAQRDAWLGQIALAQAQAGSRDASLQSAAEIQDDRARADALGRVAAEPLGARGGGVQADFDSLIDMITSTIKPTTWDAVGGPGSIQRFEPGVRVDAQGVLRPLLKQEPGGRLAELRTASAARRHQENVHRASPMRMVSLPRLERHVQVCLAAGREPTEAMQVLAGLQRVKFVFVYPESGDIVLAGPAGDWRTDDDNRIVSADTGLPVLHLEDLVVVFRHVLSAADSSFGCMITPRKEGLAKIQEFVKESNKRPLAAGQRKPWLEKLRSQLGRQDIEVYGLDPRTRTARVLVEADYRMKLVGMGLEPGVAGVKSYLDAVKLGPGGTPPPMGVLRWWFSLNYDAVVTAADRQAFELRGQGVKVESENERLTAQGERIHPGESEEMNLLFAHSFTEHFAALCVKYPIYAELRNVFDLALVAALIRAQDMPNKTGWHLTCFGNPDAYRVELGAAPKEVESVVNCRVINGKTIVAGVSGGVSCHPAGLVAARSIKVEEYPNLSRHRPAAAPKQPPLEAWWWD